MDSYSYANGTFQRLKKRFCDTVNRIHNTWKKSKFVLLEAIRLTYGNISDGHIANDSISNRADHHDIDTKLNNCNDENNYWIDLRTFTVRIMSGVEQFMNIVLGDAVEEVPGSEQSKIGMVEVVITFNGTIF